MKGLAATKGILEAAHPTAVAAEGGTVRQQEWRSAGGGSRVQQQVFSSEGHQMLSLYHQGVLTAPPAALLPTSPYYTSDCSDGGVATPPPVGHGSPVQPSRPSTPRSSSSSRGTGPGRGSSRGSPRPGSGGSPGGQFLPSEATTTAISVSASAASSPSPSPYPERPVSVVGQVLQVSDSMVQSAASSTAFVLAHFDAATAATNALLAEA